MITEQLIWTDAARAGLERYFAVRLAPDHLEGADAADLRADLQAHVTEELMERGVGTVTVEALRQALGRMGEGWPEEEDVILPARSGAVAGEQQLPAQEAFETRGAEGPDAGASEDPAASPEKREQAGGIRPVRTSPDALAETEKKRFGWIRFTLLRLPLAAFVFEILTRGCAGMMFNPMPDLWHHLLVLTVPVAAWIFLRSRTERAPAWTVRLAPWLIGAATPVVIFYAACFVMMIPAALLGILWFGVGLLALAAPLAVIGLVKAGRVLRGQEGGSAGRPMRWGFLGMAVLMVCMELPVLVTRAGISRVAESGGEATARSEAVRLVRRFGSEEALLRACYDGGRNTELGIATSTDPVSWLTGQGSLFANRDRFGRAARQAEASRDLYYRVTGTLFHAVPRPRAAMPLIPTPFNSRDRISQDEARGGTAVAGRIPGLSLAENRLDWHCEAASGLTWGEWTMTFDNRTGTAEEARCRIALPPEGFVSRVTLWVEGQPQEAAYSTVSQVRKAYQSVAVVQRRDPVLVTQPEEGSVLVQAFPVPAHGQLKTRITFTVPAGLDGRVWLPALTEQNFDLPADQTVPVWVQADRGMPELPQHWQGRAVEEGTAPTVTARMPVQDLAGNGSSFQWRPETAALVYAGDPFADANGAVVVREEKSPDVFAPRSVAWVIDTSAPLAGQADSIAAAVADLSGGAEGRVFLTGDRPDDVRALEGREILSASTFGEFQGGRDNTPVLAAAVDWLRGRPEACLIWIHGPQPAGFSDRTGLDQLLERSGSGFTLVDVPLVPGENALLAALSRPGRITLLPVRHAGPDLAGSLRSAFQRRRGEFRVIPRESLPPEAVQVGDSLVRWRARLEASRLAVTDPAAASAMAASHQVVSPWSGAVVLEKAEDYRANGLEQSDVKVSQQIPAVPEPSGVLLLLISAGHFLLRRRR